MSNRKKRYNNQEPLTYEDGTKRPATIIIPFLDNEFVEDFNGDTFVYAKDFYVVMYKKIKDEDMTYVQAYNALGFNTDILGTNRANAAGKRAMKMADENKLFTIDPASYDGSVPPERMGQLSMEEERAYLKARNIYLEHLVAAQKKIYSALEARLS